MPAPFVTRFAPSPTGLLHLGHAFSAITAFDAACAAGGRFILRIEDIDRTRCRPEFDAAIFDDLAWLGLEWEEPVRRQSEHLKEYDDALQALIDKGLVYRCFKTRKEIAEEITRAPHFAPAGPEGQQYIGAPLGLADERAMLDAGAPYAWRLSIKTAKAFLGTAYDALSFTEETPHGERRMIKATPEIFGDAIIARKDSGTSYHLASVYDDALQGVTHVIRGQDLYHAAHLHRLLQRLLDLPAPVYRHHRLITDNAGRRLAKRDKAATLAAIRKAGDPPEEIRRRLGLIA